MARTPDGQLRTLALRMDTGMFLQALPFQFVARRSISFSRCVGIFIVAWCPFVGNTRHSGNAFDSRDEQVAMLRRAHRLCPGTWHFIVFNLIFCHSVDGFSLDGTAGGSAPLCAPCSSDSSWSDCRPINSVAFFKSQVLVQSYLIRY